MNLAIKIIINVIIFCGAMGMIVFGQRTVGTTGLITMILGLAIIIAMLYNYNRKFQK
ncbi:MAG: hypothetical protein WAX04_09080 [Oscillospiraceae bacterium]